MLSKRISKLSDHLQGNIHAFASRHGLLKIIGKRKRLLSYIKDKNVQKYQDLVKKIGIRGWSPLMKKKQSKKKILNKKKNNLSEKTVFANLDKKSNTVTTPQQSSSSSNWYRFSRSSSSTTFKKNIEIKWPPPRKHSWFRFKARIIKNDW